MSTIPSADISDKKFFSDDERYADLINGLICQGRPVVRKEDLQDLDTQTGIWNDPAIHKSKNRRRVKLRDLVKKASFGVNFLVIGIENQQTIDYSLGWIRRPSRNDRFFRDSGRISSFDSELPDSSCGCPAFTEYRCF